MMHAVDPDEQVNAAGAAPATKGAVEHSASDVRVWVVRAGPGALYAPDFLRQGLVAVGWDAAGSVLGLSFDQVSERMQKAMATEPQVAIGLAAGALYRLANEMHVGDYVVTPEQGGTILVGEAAGPYEFRAHAPVEDYRHVRPVRWFARLERTRVSKEARNSLGSIMTFFVPNHQDELVGLFAPLSHQKVPEQAATASEPTPSAGGQTQVLPDQLVDPPSPPTSQFQTDKTELLYLLDQIGNRDLALPDFQRSFVWDAASTRELIVSIIRGFPAGNLLMLRGGSTVFLPRAVEEAPSLDGHEPTALVLDGQQRLSSLYQAFAGVGGHRFFVDISALMRGGDIDDAVVALAARRARLWSTADTQANRLIFPLARVRDYAYWRDDMLDIRSGDNEVDRKRLRAYLNKIESAVVSPIRAYQFPVTTLSAGTPTEAVCTIFETLNRTGIKLSVFELICARAFADGHRLRESWRSALEEHQVLLDFRIDPYYILQTISLRIGKKPQRGIVVELPVATIVAEWKSSVRAMASAIIMLRDECGVLTQQWLPYAPMLPTLAAAWRDVEDAAGATVGARRLKLQRWFWCASFAGDYDSAPNSRAEADVPLLHTWLLGGEPPQVVTGFAFESATWLNVTARQRGLYRTTVALLMRRHPLDFHQAIPLTRTVMESTAVDDHHVFPAAYLRDRGVTSHVDTVLNHTLIDRLTNASIGKRAPSEYLRQMRAALGGALTAVLTSHGLPSASDGPLLTDDYHGFLEWRRKYLDRELKAVTSEGSTVAVSPRMATESVIAAGESLTVEFKTSARWNVHTSARDDRLEKRVVVTIASFMNTEGGTLLIGLDDDGDVVGLDGDLSLMMKPDFDRYQLWLIDLLEACVGKPAAACVHVSFERLSGGDICRVDVRPSSAPVFVHMPKTETDEFYVRLGNSTRQLTMQEFDSYRSDRWG